MKKITKAGLVILGGVALGVSAASKKIKEVATSDATKEKIENYKTQAKKFQHIAECQGKKIAKEAVIKTRDFSEKIFDKLDKDFDENIKPEYCDCDCDCSECDHIEGINPDVDCPMDCSCTNCLCNQECLNTNDNKEDDSNKKIENKEDINKKDKDKDKDKEDNKTKKDDKDSKKETKKNTKKESKDKDTKKKTTTKKKKETDEK